MRIMPRHCLSLALLFLIASAGMKTAAQTALPADQVERATRSYGGTMPAAQPTSIGVKVSYKLPTDGPLPKTYLVTLAIVDPKNPDWIISTFVSGEPRTVTAENKGGLSDTWNGLDENYMPVPPGVYKVKGIFMPAAIWPVDGKYHALTAKFLGGPFCWLPPPDRENLAPKVHGDPVGSEPGDIATDGKQAAFTWAYIENGVNNFLVDLTKPINIDQVSGGWQSFDAAGGPWTATVGGEVWVVTTTWQKPIRWFLYRGDRASFTAGNRQYAFLAGEPTGLCAWRDTGNNRPLVAVAVKVTEPEPGECLKIFDGATGELLATLPLEKAGAITTRSGILYALQLQENGPAIVSTPLLGNGLPSGTWSAPLRLKGIAAPTDLDVDSRGRIYVCDRQANHVYRLAADGSVAQRWGKLHRQAEGQYDPSSFMAPARLACWTDDQGEDRVIVLEQAGPARIAEWSADGKLLRAWQTLQANCNERGGGWSVDPLHPDQAYCMGNEDWLTRFTINYTSGQWTVNAVWSGITMGKNNGWELYGFPRIINLNGRRYLASARGYMIYRFAGDRLLPSAGIIKERGKDPSLDKYFLWSDRNGDGQTDEAEWRDRPVQRPAGIFQYWGDNWQDDLSLIAPGGQTAEVWRLAPKSFDEFGNPVYEQFTKLLSDPVFVARKAGTADALHGGNEWATCFAGASDWHAIRRLAGGEVYTNIRCGYFSANHGIEQKLTRYIPDGRGGLRAVWRVGRSANIQAGPGTIYGSIHMSGPYSGLIGVVDQSRAGVHVYTADTGMFVDTLLCDGEMQYKTIYGGGAEFFAGNLFQRDNRVYIAWGKATPMLFEVRGWTTKPDVRPLTTLPTSVRITAAQIAEPPPLALKVRGGAGQARVAHFLPAVGEPPALDGTLAGWEACEPIVFGESGKQIEVRGMYDRDTLFLRWKVRSDTTVNLAALQPAEHLFSHDRGADTVGFYLQGDPTALGAAPEGRPGDVRFVAGLFKDPGQTRPAVLGLYPRFTGAGARPCTYNSPVGKASFQHVGLVKTPGLNAVLDADGKGFVLAVAIPRAAIPAAVDWTEGWKSTGNFDANFGGSRKMWWSCGDGSANRETSDEPSEARFYPGSWAQVVFAPFSDGLVIRRWQVIGPFGFAGVRKLEIRADRAQVNQTFATTSFPPEEGVDLSASYEGDQATTRQATRVLRWLPAVQTGSTLELREALAPMKWTHPEEEGTAYLATWIYAPTATEVSFRLTEGRGSHHAIRAWLNGQALPAVFPEKRGPNDLLHQLDPNAKLALQAGWNRLLLRYDLIYGWTHLGFSLIAPPSVLWTLKIANQPPPAE